MAVDLLRAGIQQRRNWQAPAADIDLTINGRRLLGAAIPDAEQSKAGSLKQKQTNKEQNKAAASVLLSACVLGGWLPTCDVIQASWLAAVALPSRNGASGILSSSCRTVLPLPHSPSV
jgi:hypothetical protein